MKKEKSKLGIISITLALLPLILIGIVSLVGRLIDTDTVPESREAVLDYLWDPMWFTICFSPLIGVLVAVVGLFQRTKARLLPIIGAVANVIIWMTWLTYLIHTMKDLDMNFGMGGF